MTGARDKQTPKKRVVGDGTPGPGRPKGSKNKATVILKDAILEALELEGGVEYLRTVARKEPKAFCALLGRVLPSQVSLTDSDGANPFAPLLQLIQDNGRPRPGR